MKIDLRDTTFVIPVRYDHKDRKSNLEMTVCMIQRDFDTNIIVGEQNGTHFEYMSKFCQYVSFDYKEFHRTRMINDMARMSTTDIFVNQDADCLVAPMQYLTAVNAIRSGDYDFAYPYGYKFIRVPRIKHRLLYEHYDLAAFATIMNGPDTKVRPSVGGIVIHNKDRFFEFGGENERFISFTPEDVERFERFTRLGLKCFRPKGHLYHLDHYRGPDSTTNNPAYDLGVEELMKERAMSTNELREYVKTWNHKQYVTNRI